LGTFTSPSSCMSTFCCVLGATSNWVNWYWAQTSLCLPAWMH
jgi:hypothetical protein